MRKVEVAGNKHYKDKTISSRLATAPPQGWLFKDYSAFDPVALQLDRRRIEAFYKERGFYAAKVTDVDVKLRGKDAVDVKFTVEEGPPTHVAAVEVTGTPANVDGRKVQKLIGIEKGERFVHPDYILAKEALLTDLVKRGYAHAEVDGRVEVDRDRRRATVMLRVDPGPLVKFGDVKVEGLKRIPKSAVLARIGWEKGETFDPVEVEATQGRLYQLGVFSVVRIDYAKEGRPEVADMTITVAEGTRHEIRVGGGVGLERERTEVHARAMWSKRGVLHPLAQLRLDARPGYTIRGTSGETGLSVEASATLEKEDFLLPRLRGSVQLAYDLEPREAYTYRGPRATLSLDRMIWFERLRAGVGYTIEQLTFTQVDPALAALDFQLDPYRLGFFTQHLMWDNRDVPLDATRGFYLALQLEEGGPYAGGEFEYIKATPDARAYVPLGKRLVAAGRARAGRMFTASDAESPLTQRYYGGGSSGHRGFGFRRLSPMIQSERGTLVPVGGTDLLETSFELRYQTFKFKENWVSVVAFVDGGDVTRKGDLQVGNLHWATGLGLRYDTIIGPIRIDVGYRLNRTEAAGEDGLMNPDPGSRFKRFAFHFSLGEAF